MNRLLTLLLSFLLTIHISYGQTVYSDIADYTAFLETQNTNAKDYILNLWNKYDIVVLCERNHGEMTQYDLILDIVKSDYFIENVGNIFTEIGTVSRQKDVLKFIKTTYNEQETKKKALLELYRNIEWPCWEKSNFYFFLDSLNSLNNRLPNDLKINLFVSDEKDPAQGSIKSSKDLQVFLQNESDNRDSVMASNIIQAFDSIRKSNSARKKCFVIMNYRHAFSKSIDNRINDYLNITNVGTILFNQYLNKTANVYLNSLALTKEPIDTTKNKSFRDYAQTPIQNGKWDASFELLGKESIGFDFANTPFGKDSLDIWPWSNQYTFQDIFTGFAYYLPLKKHYEASGIPGFLNDGFENELFNRLVIFTQVYGGNKIEKDELKKYFNYSENKYDRQQFFDEIIDEIINERKE